MLMFKMHFKKLIDGLFKKEVLKINTISYPQHTVGQCTPV